MKLRRSFVPRQLLFLLAAGLVTTGALPALTVRGQDTITLANGQTQQVQILGTTLSGVQIQTSQGVLVYPFRTVTQVAMEPPPEFKAAQAAYETGDLQVAVSNAEAVVKKFRGLPLEWARQAMLLLGDIYVGLNRLPDAKTTYADFQQAYPGAGGAEITVGLALIDLANKNFDAAKAKIEPILAQALKQRTPPKAAALLIGRAFFVSGQIKEASGDPQGALEDYLRTVAIFPEDRVAAAGAQEHADRLRKEHGIAVP